MDRSNGKERSACFSVTGDRADHREWCRRSRLGILFIIIGTLWLMAGVGWIAGDLFCPLMLIVVGLWICITSVMSKNKNVLQGTILTGIKKSDHPTGKEAT
ncbi:MAG: hypothetical protein CVU61_00230 [Deltaproteobacteria bacterium HGW-Deltaproteobacteria-19]|jgi:hypothetical protein|nr:MAG: hypothetical protein CVU61_00230 [Deltaproteobacteria bacterium HGW-Deltaproteobacteria-19]